MTKMIMRAWRSLRAACTGLNARMLTVRMLAAGILAGAVLAAPLLASPVQAADCAVARGGEARLGTVRYVTPSGWLPPETLAAIAADYAGCRRDVPAVEAVIAAVNRAYTDVGADLAFADFAGTDGDTILIELVEIRYEAIDVEGATTTRPDYVRARAGAAAGDLVDLPALQQRLERLPQTDDIRVAADLRPGAARGTSRLVLRVDEPPPVRRVITLDNTGSPDSGRAVLSGGVTIASLTGLRDPLSVFGAVSEGKAQASIGYARPVGGDGARLSFGVSFERTRTLRAAPPLDDLISEALFASVGYTRPLRLTDSATDSLALSLALAVDRSDLAGIALSDLRSIEASVGSSHLRRFPGRGLVTLTQSLRFGRVDDRLTPARYNYVRHTGALSGVVLMGSDWTLGGELRWQFADGPLPTFARIASTGTSGVRGYQALGISDDETMVLRSELRRNPVAWGNTGLTASPFLHADIGRGSSFGAGNARVRGPVRKSVGAGVDLRRALRGGQTLVGSLVISVPLTDAAPRVTKGSPEVIAVVSVEF